MTQHSGPLPGRDPLAEDDDLLTMAEAGARLTEELESERATLRALEAGAGDDRSTIEALQRRIALLQDAAARMMARRGQ